MSTVSDRIKAVMEEDLEVSAAEVRRLNGGKAPAAQDLLRLTEKARSSARVRKVAAVRAAAVLEAAAAVRKRSGRVACPAPGGRVLEFERVEAAPGYPDGTAVLVRPLGAPHNGDGDVVVVNPPVLVPDPGGPVVRGGQRYREDPLACLAQAVLTAYGQRTDQEAPPWQ